MLGDMGIGIRKVGALLAYLLLFFLLISQFCTAIDTISRIQPITESQVLTSANGTFELGFFSPGNSSNLYVGIWHKAVPRPLRKVVWVANRDKPLTDSSGILTISNNENIVILDGNGKTIWSTSITSSVRSNSSLGSVAVLLDTGNLVLKENSSIQEGRVLWESFNYPSDTFLSTMKLGFNLKTGDKMFLTPWKSKDDPSPGNFIYALDPLTSPTQGMLSDSNGTKRYFRTGQWNNRSFIGIEAIDALAGYLVYNMSTNYREEAMNLTFYTIPSDLVTFFFVNSSGILNMMFWIELYKQWYVNWNSQQSDCLIYGFCGPNGSCKDRRSPICKCLIGYEPKSQEDWGKGNWTDGCVRRTQLECQKNVTSKFDETEDRFLKLPGMKVPDLSEQMENIGDAKECEVECLKNCSCVAYSYVRGIGCMVWKGEMMDVNEFNMTGKDLFIRLAISKFSKKTPLWKFIIIIPITLGTCTLCILGYILFRRKANQRGTSTRLPELIDSENTEEISREEPQNVNMFNDGANEGKTSELQLFDFASLVIATDNFSLTNKLGEGGFGPVYKGKLQSGQDIAVKRLSKSSGQGIEEFKNEITLISKLRHRNLVKLLGCCIEGEENMLLYEYMPNKSLDAFLFDRRKSLTLDWRQRFNIVEGISRGLLYLHRDSPLRIIHRDLKVSNILLDEDMSPKISDFGLARIFGGKQTIANTSRVVGTIGYMAPEYLMGGTFSDKSDVFSFGVLLLEIVSGKRNNSFYRPERPANLLVHTWRSWNEGKWSEIVDESLGDSYSPLEARRCIHVGLLCVQERAIDRPSMSTTDLMLGSETNRPQPKEPPFISETSSELDFQNIDGTNDLTITEVEGR